MSEFNAAAFPFPAFATKAARLEWFRTMLGTAPEWAVWGVATVLTYQTDVEQSAEVTDEDNGVGFTGTDAKFLTSLAKQWAAKNWLSDKQMGHLYKKMPKYAAQLIRHLETAGVTFVIDKKAAAQQAAAAILAGKPDAAAVAAVSDAAPAEVAPSPMFDGIDAAEAANVPPPVEPKPFGTAPAAKPGEPDWKLYRKLLGMSNKPDAWAEYQTLVNPLIGKADAFAANVWKTCVEMMGKNKVPSFKQAKVIAIACAKVSAGIPCGKVAAA